MRNGVFCKCQPNSLLLSQFLIPLCIKKKKKNSHYFVPLQAEATLWSVSGSGEHWVTLITNKPMPHITLHPPTQEAAGLLPLHQSYKGEKHRNVVFAAEDFILFSTILSPQAQMLDIAAIYSVSIHSL